MPRGVRSTVPDWVTHALVRDLFDYDPWSGDLLWKVDTQYKKLKGKCAGSVGKKGYIEVELPGAFRVKAHRLIWFWVHGVWPQADVDHRDRVRSNNRFLNLREAGRGQNNINSPTGSANTSGAKGVSLIASTGMWRSYITVNRRQIHLGHFSKKEDAIASRRAAEREHFPGFSLEAA